MAKERKAIFSVDLRAAQYRIAGVIKTFGQSRDPFFCGGDSPAHARERKSWESHRRCKVEKS